MRDARLILLPRSLLDNTSLEIITVIKPSHWSNINPMLSLNQNGRDLIFQIYELRRSWSTLDTALPWNALRLSGSHCDRCCIWGKWGDLTFPWIVSLDRAPNDDIIFIKNWENWWHQNTGVMEKLPKHKAPRSWSDRRTPHFLFRVFGGPKKKSSGVCFLNWCQAKILENILLKVECCTNLPPGLLFLVLIIN